MKKINKNNLFMYVLVVLAIVMLSSTLTMAVLTDRKKGKEDLVFGKVAISGQNSLLELDIEDAVTIGTEILTNERYFYFSPTSDTEDMIVRFKIEYKGDVSASKLALLNKTLSTEYFETASVSGDSGYKYILRNGYYYMVKKSATEINLDNMRVLKSTENNVKFIISDSYEFNGLTKSEQAELFDGILGKNVKLVVTVEASQSEGLSALTDVWPISGSVTIYTDGVQDGQPLTTTTGKITLPTEAPTKTGYEFSVWEDEGGNIYNLGETIEVNSDIDITTKWAGLYHTDYPELGIFEEEQQFTNWSDLDITIEDNIVTGNDIVSQEIYGDMYFPTTITGIGENAFNGSVLTGIILPDSIHSIGESAFDSCVYVFRLQIPKNEYYTRIENNTFNFCAPKKLTIPNTIREIGDYAFFGNEEITEIIIPESVETIGECAFGNNYFVEKFIFSENSHLTSIGDSAFCYMAAVNEMLLPDSVTTLGEDVFYKCVSLIKVKLPENELFTTLSCDLFSDCYNLLSVAIPDTVTTIEDCVFCNCYNLCEIIIPASVETIGEWVFDECSKLIHIKNYSSNINLDESNFMNEEIEILNSEDLNNNNDFTYALIYNQGRYYTYHKEGKVILMGYEHYNNEEILSIPDGITDIYDGRLFYEEPPYELNIKKVIFPNSLEHIGESVFESAINLKEVVFGNNLKSIGAYAFYENGLTALTIPESVVEIQEGAFLACKNLKTITFRPGNQDLEIGDYAFQACEILESIVIPARVTTLTERVFMNCYNLNNVRFEQRTESISLGNYLFDSCYNLNDITIPGNAEIGTEIFINCKQILQITDLSGSGFDASDFGVTTAEVSTNGTFSNGTLNKDIVNNIVTFTSDNKVYLMHLLDNSATSVTIPGNITDIADYAFYKNGKLTEVTFANGTEDMIIGSNAFYSSGITNITIPARVVKICSSAFSYCNLLLSVEFEERTKNIDLSESNIFSWCSKLRSIILPDETTNTLGINLFKQSGITSINIPANITIIKSLAFESCYSLEIVKFAETTNNLTLELDRYSKNVFNYCSNIKNIYIETAGAYADTGIRTLISGITSDKNVYVLKSVCNDPTAYGWGFSAYSDSGDYYVYSNNGTNPIN